MNKENAKKATFEDLIKRKLQKEKDQNRTKDIYVPSMDRTLVFKKPKDNVLLDVIDEMGDMNVMSKVIEGYKKLIYLCCDMLQDTELHEKLEIVDPFEVVDKIFDLKDITEIGEQLMDLVNVSDKAEEVKN